MAPKHVSVDAMGGCRRNSFNGARRWGRVVVETVDRGIAPFLFLSKACLMTLTRCKISTGREREKDLAGRVTNLHLVRDKREKQHS